MHYFEYINRDTTIYSGGTTSSLNSGHDEIIEVVKEVSSDGGTINISRILLSADYSYVSKSIQDGKIPTDAKFYLNLYDAGSKDIEAEQKLVIYMVSGSWKSGTGKKFDSPITTNGASYQYRDQDQKLPWVTGSLLTDGGSWFSGSQDSYSQYNISQSYNLTFDKRDVRFDVTDLVRNHIFSSSIYPNNGFIVKRESTGSYGTTYAYSGDTNSEEGGTSRLGTLQFFSRETHTIYPPSLEVVWDDSKWTTGSLAQLTGSALDDTVIYFKGIRDEYLEKSISRFRLVGRPRYNDRVFGTTPEGLTVRTLPSGSTFYSIKDSVTEETIVPFGTGSIVSCDGTGNYFNLRMDSFQSERHYDIHLKVVSGSGTVDELINYYNDPAWSFKVVRNIER
ncbi:MAG: hypothetical protein CMD43_03035 [Gammaproteobacteria bacterium]|jgi:hypothetical protein|nr:hypothetical protein [Gammaproteobacteria bacterium]